MQFDIAKDILKGFSIPTQPSIISAIRNVAPDLNLMADLIEQDPGLSAAVLKVTNSPVFALPIKVTSITNAMSLLGIDGITSILNAAAYKRVVGDFTPSDELTAFWNQTTIAAVAISAVIRQLNIDPSIVTVDEAYCLGLFHHCGIPILFQKHPNYFEILLSADHSPGKQVTDIENKVFKTNHAVLGYYIMKSWNLPKTLCEVTRLHHNRQALENLDSLCEQEAILLAALKIAEYIIDESTDLGCDEVHAEWQDHGPAITYYVGISEIDLSELRDIVLDAVEEQNIRTL